MPAAVHIQSTLQQVVRRLAAHPAGRRDILRFARLALASLLLTAAPAVFAQASDHRMVFPRDLKWADVPSLPRGAKIAVIEGPMNEAVPFTVRLRLPADYRIPAHWHPAIERVTVLSGTFFMGVGDTLDIRKGMGLTPGAMMIMQPKTAHFAWTQGEVEIQLHGVGPWGITYVNSADDPRKSK